MMKFKRGILVFLALALLLLIISNSSAAFLSIQSIVESPWVNAALLFLLVFNFVLMIFRDVFRGSYGAAVIIAIVVGLGASLGVTYYFGAFLSKIGVWLLIIFVVAIAILVFRLTRRGGAGTGIVFWILGVSSVAWLAFIHKEVCPPVGGLPDNVCQVLDVLAIIILIICLIRLIKWVIKLFRRDNRQGQGRDGGRRRGENDGNPGNLTGYVRDRTTGTGISGASVEVHGGRVGQSAMTDASGHYSLTLPGRRFRNPLRRWPLRRPNYRVVANASGYDSDEYNVMINAGRATRQDFHLSPIGGGPELIRAWADPDNLPGPGNTNIHWETRNADEVNIIGVSRVAPPANVANGHHTIRVNATRTFHVQARNAAGRTSNIRDVTVTVGTPPPRVNVHISIHGNGTTTPAAGDHPYARADTVHLQARPNPGATFDHWIIRGPGMGGRAAGGSVTIRGPGRENYDLPLNRPALANMADIFVEAHFTAGPPPTDVELILNYNPGQGEIRGPAGVLTPGTHRFRRADNINLQAVPRGGAAFREWRITETRTGPYHPNPLPISRFWQNPSYAAINAFHVTAIFTGGTPGVNVHVSVHGNGTTTPAAGTHAHARTDTVNLQAHPNTGATFDHWIIRGPGIGGRGRAAAVTIRTQNYALVLNRPALAGMTDIYAEAHFTGGTTTPPGGNTTIIHGNVTIDQSTNISNIQDHSQRSVQVDNSRRDHSLHYNLTDASRVTVVGPNIRRTTGPSGNVFIREGDVHNEPYTFYVTTTDNRQHVFKVNLNAGKGEEKKEEDKKRPQGPSNIMLWVSFGSAKGNKESHLTVKKGTPIMVHWRANNVKQLKIMIPSAGRTLYSGADRGLKIMGGIRKNADITYEPKQDTKFVAVALDYNNKEITDYAIVNVTKEDIKEEKKEKNTLKHLEDKKRITEERYKKYIQEEEHRMGGWNPKTREYKKSERKVEQLKIRMDREIRKIDEEIRKLRH